MDWRELAAHEEEWLSAGYVPVADVPPGTSAEAWLKQRWRALPEDAESDSVMLVVDEGSGRGQPAAWLNAGIAREHGMLQWVDRSGYYVPSARHNLDREGRIYFRHPTGVTLPLSAEMKAPLPLVYEAVAEVILTKMRPTCVEWERMPGRGVLA